MVQANPNSRKLALATATVLLAVPFAQAQSSTTTTLSQATTEIASSICSVVSLVQYIAGAIAVLALVVLGIQFMAVGSNPMAREELKTKMAYVVAGMIVVLVASYVVQIFMPSASFC